MRRCIQECTELVEGDRVARYASPYGSEWGKTRPKSPLDSSPGSLSRTWRVWNRHGRVVDLQPRDANAHATRAALAVFASFRPAPRSGKSGRATACIVMLVISGGIYFSAMPDASRAGGGSETRAVPALPSLKPQVVCSGDGNRVLRLARNHQQHPQGRTLAKYYKSSTRQSRVQDRLVNNSDKGKIR